MHKILVIDDDKGVTRALAIRLRSAGFEVVTCNAAEEASSAAVRERPAVIILDVDMPHYTGFEFHQCLQFAQRVCAVPVVYLSGHDTEVNRRMAAEQGAMAFVTKPYDSDQLMATIRSTIDRSRLAG